MVPNRKHAPVEGKSDSGVWSNWPWGSTKQKIGGCDRITFKRWTRHSYNDIIHGTSAVESLEPFNKKTQIHVFGLSSSDCEICNKWLFFLEHYLTHTHCSDCISHTHTLQWLVYALTHTPVTSKSHSHTLQWLVYLLTLQCLVYRSHTPVTGISHTHTLQWLVYPLTHTLVTSMCPHTHSSD